MANFEPASSDRHLSVRGRLPWSLVRQTLRPHAPGNLFDGVSDGGSVYIVKERGMKDNIIAYEAIGGI